MKVFVCDFLMDSPASSLPELLSNLSISDSCQQALLTEWTVEQTLARGDFLVFKGNIEKCLFYVESGLFRIWYPVGDEEATVGFGYPGTFLTSFPSFVGDRPSDYFIQALSVGQVIGIPKTAFYTLLESFPDLEVTWRKLIEQALLGRIEREIDLLTPTPAERLARLQSRSPHLFQIIPLKYIASYLRMTPETLSRLRSL